MTTKRAAYIVMVSVYRTTLFREIARKLEMNLSGCLICRYSVRTEQGQSERRVSEGLSFDQELGV